MKSTGNFLTSLDLGDMGDEPAVVTYSAYRPAYESEDDRSTMELTSVCTTLCGAFLNVRGVLHDDTIERIREEAWAEVPTHVEAIAERRAELVA